MELGLLTTITHALIAIAGMLLAIICCMYFLFLKMARRLKELEEKLNNSKGKNILHPIP